MLRLEPFVFCCNNMPGNEVLPALDLAKACGFRWVELAAIDGISEQIRVERISAEYVAEIAQELEKRDLQCYSFSGHCDLTDPEQFQQLLKKVHFAGQIGAKQFNTRCGAKEHYPVFKEHVKQAADLAASYEMVLNLESYGDIVDAAQWAGEVFADLNLENVSYNYDPGNIYRFARGKICIEDDLAAATMRPGYMHLKDVAIDQGYLKNVPIGQGDLHYEQIFHQLEQLVGTLPCGLEVPKGFQVCLRDFSREFIPTTFDAAMQAVLESVAFIQKHAVCIF